jgi:transcriptional regulator with XRE-family HTH domain
MLKELGVALREAREKDGSSLENIAQPAKISAAYLHKLENGVVSTPSPRVLRRLADVLGLQYLDLMELAGYLSAEEVAYASKRRPQPKPHPLAGKELTQEEWRAVGAFVKALIAQRKEV